jgi:segregation and condensation protein B
MSLKAKIEAIIYAAETPITLDQIVQLVKDSSDGGDANELRAQVRTAIDELTAEYAAEGRGIEIRQIAGGYRMSTKPEQHDVVRAFAKSLKPPIRLSLPALETLAVIAYKQPVTVPEISEIRGVDSSGVIATLLDRKLITTCGRKDVIGRPILYKTTKEFLLRFGLKDVNELPSMEEFEKLVAESFQSDLLPAEEAQTQQPATSQTAGEQQEPAQVEAEKSA